MARSNRRRRRASASTANPRSYSDLRSRVEHSRTEKEAETHPKAPETPKSPASPTSLRGSDRVNWQTEYKQVLADLRQLLIVSAALFVVMVVLGFVL